MAVRATFEVTVYLSSYNDVTEADRAVLQANTRAIVADAYEWGLVTSEALTNVEQVSA